MTDEQTLAPLLCGPVSIVRAFKPGDIVFIEMLEHPSDAVLKSMRDYVEAVSAQVGLKILLLGPGMKVAGASASAVYEPTIVPLAVDSVAQP